MSRAVAVSNRDWAQRINTAWVKAQQDTVLGFLKVGRELLAAKEKLEHGDFGKMIEAQLKFTSRAARMLMTIALEYNRISKNGSRASVLPAAWATLYEVARLPDDQFQQLLKAGLVRPDADRADIRSFASRTNRVAKHRKIAAVAKDKMTLEQPGPFPLIYADPPWKWGHFGEQDKENEKGKGRTPDQHYPTMTHEEILNYKVGGKAIVDVAHKTSALLLWCTSSNLDRALEVMVAWGFVFKASAAWDKIIPGMGLIFRNQHEVLLYGTRGSMPGPQFQPSSVFRFKRTRHSAKPPEIRGAIEKMYPNFDEKTRLELFAREEKIKGWTTYGFEAHDSSF